MLVTRQTNMVNLFYNIEISVYYLEFSFSVSGRNYYARTITRDFSRFSRLETRRRTHFNHYYIFDCLLAAR